MDIHFWNDETAPAPTSRKLVAEGVSDLFAFPGFTHRPLESMTEAEQHRALNPGLHFPMATMTWEEFYLPFDEGDIDPAHHDWLMKNDDVYKRMVHRLTTDISSLSEDNHSLSDGGNHV